MVAPLQFAYQSTIAPLARICNATLFFALKVQYNLAQGKRMVCATPWVNMAFPLCAPCKGSKITSVALRRDNRQMMF